MCGCVLHCRGRLLVTYSQPFPLRSELRVPASICGKVQTEWLVIENCLVTSDISQSVGLTKVEELFSDEYTLDVVCKIVHDILKSYQ